MRVVGPAKCERYVAIPKVNAFSLTDLIFGGPLVIVVVTGFALIDLSPRRSVLWLVNVLLRHTIDHPRRQASLLGRVTSLSSGIDAEVLVNGVAESLGDTFRHVDDELLLCVRSPSNGDQALFGERALCLEFVRLSGRQLDLLGLKGGRG